MERGGGSADNQKGIYLFPNQIDMHSHNNWQQIVCFLELCNLAILIICVFIILPSIIQTSFLIRQCVRYVCK